MNSQTISSVTTVEIFKPDLNYWYDKSRKYWYVSQDENRNISENIKYKQVKNTDSFIGTVYTIGNPSVRYTGNIKFEDKIKKSDFVLESKWIEYNPTTESMYTGYTYETYIKKGKFVQCKTYVIKH